jgi:hypothetical protein
MDENDLRVTKERSIDSADGPVTAETNLTGSASRSYKY